MTKRMIHRQAKLPLASRIMAAGCIAIWVAGVSACDLEALFCCESQGSETVAHVDHEHSHDTEHAGTNDPHDADAHHSGETDGHSNDSPIPDSKEGLCCSTLNAVAQTSTSAGFGKPALLPVSFLCVPMEAHAITLALLDGPPNRHAKSGDRVFTPEVCLGSAFHSNAPPAFG